MELSRESEDDFLYWKYHPSGRYTIKTGYYYLTKELGLESSTFLARDQDFVKLLWKMKLQPKWKLFHDGIAVKVNLAKRGFQIDTVCDHCRAGNEDSQHLFRFCTQAKEVWDSEPLNICLDFYRSFSLKRWIQHYILLFYSEDGKHGTRIALFIATLWGLWKSRNERCFKEVDGTTSRVKEFIYRAMQDHEILINQDSLADESEATSRDSSDFPPGFNHVQLGKENGGFDDFVMETDGSWDKNTTREGIGWAVKVNNKGYALEEGDKHGVVASVIHCEAWACPEAMKWARAKGRQGILIFSDSASLLNNLQDTKRRKVSITWIIKELRKIGTVFQRCTILKVPREQVQRANDIARQCRVNLTN
ncbi:uncharacterized protein LOC110684696 [Chenopodium quinoa]|uniref:uncharacterized protein LOC110684696 n=1 Tax=Chenopodium quinoa TaxID=63459 RepID=UPI000B786E6C|nr:uncharacterized protein LOC110684696 [Chenopodium quinoa]